MPGGGSPAAARWGEPCLRWVLCMPAAAPPCNAIPLGCLVCLPACLRPLLACRLNATARLPACLPAGAIIVDESLTSGGSYFALSRGCPQFSHLTLTGTELLPLPLQWLLLQRCWECLLMRPCYLWQCLNASACHLCPPLPTSAHPCPCRPPLCAGGAIGAGIPLAVGAAVACPDRVVINLQVRMASACVFCVSGLGACVRRLCVVGKVGQEAQWQS